MSKEKDGILDLSGRFTGIAANKRFLISLGSCLVIYFVLALWNPLAAYGPLASKAVGFFLAVIVFMVTARTNIAISGILVATLGTMIGFYNWSVVSERLGSSQFYNMLGMIMVAAGCEFTNFGRRFSYWVLRAFGQKPKTMVLFIGISAAILSSFVSNAAVIVLYSSIMNNLLITMGEKPGESKLGRILMLTIPLCACVGGMALFCGSPVGNAASLAFMTAAIGDESYAPTFAQWASISVPSFLIVIVPTLFIYIKWFKLGNDDSKCPPKEYYDELLKELGPMGGSEYRWLLYVAGMVAAMLLGMRGPFAALFFAVLTVFPIIGVANCSEVLKKVPWGAMLAICMLPLLGVLITGSGMSDWVRDVVTPLVRNVNPVVFSIIVAVLMSLCVNLLVNAMQGTMALIMSIAAPLCISFGYNPTIILLPAAFSASFFWALGANQYVAINYEYGWWEMKDPIAPGLLAAVLVSVVSALVACLLGPLFGMPLYL